MTIQPRWSVILTFHHDGGGETVVTLEAWTRWGAERRRKAALALTHPDKRSAVTTRIQKAGHQ